MIHKSHSTSSNDYSPETTRSHRKIIPIKEPNKPDNFKLDHLKLYSRTLHKKDLSRRTFSSLFDGQYWSNYQMQELVAPTNASESIVVTDKK